MFDVIDWLRQHIPLEDSSGAAGGLVHGDFRIDNLVFHPLEVCFFAKPLINEHVERLTPDGPSQNITLTILSFILFKLLNSQSLQLI